MRNLDYKQFTERHRPHIQPPDSIIFVAYRLAGSIPRAIVREYKARKVWLDDQGGRIRSELRKSESPEAKRWLEQVENFKRQWFVKFEAIMHSLKGSSARECNLVLSRVGQFWEHESFDHVVREGNFYRTIRYVLNNPVKAGLVNHWQEWRWNYCRSELIDNFDVRQTSVCRHS